MISCRLPMTTFSILAMICLLDRRDFRHAPFLSIEPLPRPLDPDESRGSLRFYKRQSTLSSRAVECGPSGNHRLAFRLGY